MSSTAGPYGLVPFDLVGGAPLGTARAYTLSSNSATGYFAGDIVNMAAGVLTPIAATPTTTRNGNTPVGIFIGCEYTPAGGGLPVSGQYLPANAITGGATNVIAYVIDNPDVRFKIQADGSVAYTDIGKNAALSFTTVGSTFTGNSGVALDQSTIDTTNTLAVRIVDIAPGPGNAAGDAYTDVICVFNAGVHEYRNPTGA